jgi:hypothetical protein
MPIVDKVRLVDDEKKENKLLDVKPLILSVVFFLFTHLMSCQAFDESRFSSLSFSLIICYMLTMSDVAHSACWFV